MGLGGVIFAGVGIVVVVLVANDRFGATWNAMLGNDANGRPLRVQPTSTARYTQPETYAA